MSNFNFKLIAQDQRGRVGEFHTPHGVVQTPLFAPVGTQGTVKALTPRQLEEVGATLILANTYHLYLRPGEDLVADMGGLHNFMQWSGPILTDSGGYQVFSLSKQREIDEDGVTFRSHIDGSLHRFTPELAIAIQEKLGGDIVMAFDECAPPYDRAYNEEAMRRTHLWAERSLQAKSRRDQAVFGIIQGGIFPDLRIQSAQFISSMKFSGVAIGGLSVGETKQEMLEMLDVVEPHLPQDKPRYLMGVGSPEDLVEAVVRGIDLFDCVLPTRMARNHSVLTRRGRLNLRNAKYAQDPRPIDAECTCYTCQSFSRAYLRHIIVAQEMLAASLLSIHNLHMLITLMHDLREAIINQKLGGFAEAFRGQYQKHRPKGT